MKHTRLVILSSALSVCLIAAPALADSASTKCQSADAGGSDLLALDIETLSNVKVTTASKFAQSVSEAPGVITVVSRDELQRWGGVTLSEVLNRVPGLSESSSYFTDRSIVAARGDQTKSNGGHVLFLINGRPTREILEGGLVSDLLESFPVASLERIEVIKGPGSVLYGSNAFSAVINLITRKDANGFSASALPGRSGTLASAGEGSYTCGSFSITGAGQVHQKPIWNTTYQYGGPVNEINPGGQRSQNAAIPDRSHGGYLSASYKGLSIMSSYTDWQTASFVRGVVGYPEWKRGWSDVGYEFNPSPRWNSTVNFTYTRNTFAVLEYPFVQRDSNEKLVEWTNVVKPTERDQLTFGTLFNHVQGQETYYGVTPPFPISNGSRNGSAAYAQLDHQLIKGLKGIVGLQANKIGDLSINVVPRGGLLWAPASRLTFKALYGEAYRAPSINETTLNHPQLAGTPGLRPEKVGTFDLEVAYHDERIEGSVNYFLSKQTDSIVVDTSTSRWTYQNLGTATFHGVEAEGKYYVTKKVLFVGSVLHQTNHDGNGAEDITPIPDLQAKGGVSYQGAGDGLTLSVFDSYRETNHALTSMLNPVPTATQTVSAQLRLNVSQYFHGMGAKGLTFVTKADNLLNNRVWLPDLGGGTGDSIPVGGGRTIYVGAELSFNRTPRAATPVATARD